MFNALETRFISLPLSVGSYLLGQVSLCKNWVEKRALHRLRKVYIYFSLMYFLLEQITYYLRSLWGNVNILEHIPLLHPFPLTFPLATWPSEEKRREGGTPELACDPSPLPSLLTVALSILSTLPFHFPIQEEWEAGQHLTLQCHTPITLNLCLPSLLSCFIMTLTVQWAGLTAGPGK